jgi:hypothetical protein
MKKNKKSRPTARRPRSLHSTSVVPEPAIPSRASGGRRHVDCHASRLRAHVCQRSGIRGFPLPKGNRAGRTQGRPATCVAQSPRSGKLQTVVVSGVKVEVVKLWIFQLGWSFILSLKI